MLGTRFDDALALASELHRRQVRKDAPIPYISHLMAVAGIVLEANAYHPMDNLEDVAIGALLHDAVEDQGHKIGLEEIRERFGETVHRIVQTALAGRQGTLPLEGSYQVAGDAAGLLRRQAPQRP